MQLKWSESLSVGVDVIDTQHKGLVALVNRFDADLDELCGLDSLTDKTKKMRIYMTILNLRTYFLEHFSTEERLMMKSRYPDFLAHKKEHDMFIRKVFDFEHEYLEGNLSVAKKINEFLKIWVLGHLKKTDRGYIDHFRRHLRRDEAPPERLEDIGATVEAEEAGEAPEPEQTPEAGPESEQASGPTSVQAEDKDILVDMDKGLLEEHYRNRRKK